MYDWARDTLTQLTFDPGSDTHPVWTPDGKRVAFTSDRAKPGGPRNVYWVNADGTGEVTRLTDSPDWQFPFSWHPSGKFLGFSEVRAGSGSGYDVMILPMEGDASKGWKAGTPTVFLGTWAEEVGPMFSPDGRFARVFPVPREREQARLRGLRASVPGSRRPMARFGQWRHLSPLVRHDARVDVG